MVVIGNTSSGQVGTNGNGDLTAVVSNGNGIRANASIQSNIKNGITVLGKTDITINGGEVTSSVTLSDDRVDEMIGDKHVGSGPFAIYARDQLGTITVSAGYMPAAVYAGNDMYDFTCEASKLIEGAEGWEWASSLFGNMSMHLGNAAAGQGNIVLHDTNLTIQKSDDGKEGGYGLFAGKNGHIQVDGNLTITSEAANSYGIAAKNANLIYGDSLSIEAETDGLLTMVGSSITSNLEDYPLDTSANTHGTSVMLGEGKDVSISMQGDNSYAMYAEGVDDTKEKNRNRITGNKINSLNLVGDVEAENGGLIDLHVTGNTQSVLQGDVKAYGLESGKDAAVNLTVDNALAGKGTIAAANDGKVNLKLGAYSNWSGRIDDYQDADSEDWNDHKGAIDNAFGDDKEISSSGTVNLSLGENATWNVEGQSWVTKLSGADSIVFLAKNDENTGEAVGQALHVGTLEDSHTFVMNVAAENGDMLYVKNGTGAQQHLVINNREEVLEKMKVDDKIRFATVQDANGGFVDAPIDDTSILPSDSGSGAFGASTRIEGAGVYNVDFGIEYHDYDTEVEGDLGTDETYNGSAFDENKPGDSYVDDNYGPAAGGTEKQALFAENGGEETPSGSKNVYIVRKDNTMDNLSNGGKTVIAMSKVNYSNAVYMDRLNKRMGEARFLEGDDGLWVRLRHDRIGKSDAFRSKNTMFEIGYDWKDEAQKDGTHYRGFAFDYMRGTADYTNVLGEGDVRRAGLWYHDTWMGDKGHYTDYVVKYGRLSNDFDIYSERGEKIKGDYDNDVWSVSAEYGRKKDLGNDWYIEPQAQLQYAYVTSADYTTNQGTKVSLDSIDSLIGRAGFRLGRDTSEGNTVYFKADILHEFLGDQRVHASDITGALDTTYDNEGTWYDVGFGFSHRMGEDSYMFLDVEHSFGNDNEDTYQINIGLNRAF